MGQHTSLADFEKFAGRAGLIPVCREIIADLDTPLTIFAKMADAETHAFLLESMEGGEKWGRYSFIGFSPLVTIESRADLVSVERRGQTVERRGDPLAIIKEVLASFNALSDLEAPRFFGGAVGFLGYDIVRFIERLPEKNPGLDHFPDSSFMVPKVILIFDNLRQSLTIVNCVEVDDREPAEQYAEAVAEIDRLLGKLENPVPYETLKGGNKGRPHEFVSNMSRAEYMEMVSRAKEYILAGDIFQVVLSQRFHAKTNLNPILLYRALRHINPSPYLFYLKLGDTVLIGSSPEILVRLEGDDVEVRPIAGTRKRGSSREEDAALEQELLSDPKERAEHLMLVDLGRNDVGRVSSYGSVQVSEKLVIERYSHVMHIVSGVHGVLEAGKDQFDVLRACYPAGTVSGAPKIRAMEIIEELEPERRGPYAGAVGYFGFSGNMDFCITIRTFVMQGDNLWLQAGAGIVADSDPATEFEETLNKARGLRRAVELTEQGL